MLLIILLVAGALIIISFYYFFNRIGDSVDAGRSDSYYHHARKKLIVYSPMGNWFELGYYETEADPATFNVIAREYGKDKKNIFWKGRVQQVHYETFSIDEEGIPRDEKHVYYEKQGQDMLAAIPGADPKTFQSYKEGTKASHDYLYQDKSSFYLNGEKIDVDRETFVRLNLTLGVDKNFVYAIINRNTVVSKLDTPPGKPAAISENYARIGNAIMVSNWKTEFAVIHFPIINSIRVLNERNISVNGQLIRDGHLIAGVDIATWEDLGVDHFKDRNSVYFEDKIIEQADPATFQIVAEGYSKDKQHVFYHHKILNGADPVLFKYDFGKGLGTDGKLFFKNGEVFR